LVMRYRTIGTDPATRREVSVPRALCKTGCECRPSGPARAAGACVRTATTAGSCITRTFASTLSLGAMLMGSRTDEATSFAILDRYVEAGGTFIDTSGNYAFWVHGTQGGESEELLGRWRRSRGIGDEIVIATKVGARPLAPSTGFGNVDLDGLSAKAIRE